MSKTIPIFYACDNNFFKYTVVSLASMIANASPRHQYEVHILHTDITPENQAIAKRLETKQFTVTFDDVTEYLHSIKDKMPIRDYYSKTTYYRLFIADMFPEIKKTIYIDSDTIVQGNIAELYDHNISDYAVGACHEQAMVQENVYGTYVEKCIGIDRNSFFNAGVLLINCEYFRENKVLGQFMELLGFYNFRVTQDEDYLNVICRDKVLFLHQKWNTEVFGDIFVPLEEACVIHYIMVAKPWHFHDCHWGDIFWKYAEQTEVYGDLKEILDTYTDEQRAEDMASCDRLAQLAIEETNRPDTYVARVKEKVREERMRVLEKIEQYEREGRFDEDVEDDPPGRQIRPGEVDYLRKKPISRVNRRIAYNMAKHFLDKILKEKKMIVKDIIGAEHFAELESGAMITCNHFNAFDSFAMQMAYEKADVKGRALFRIIREGNYTSFPGFYGYLMRNYNTLPLSSNAKVMQEFMRATSLLLQKGHFILIYPEQSMWWNYRKPKPLQKGGYYIAARNNVPVLPCFITMEDSDLIGEDGFPIQEYTIHVCTPIYPDPEKTVKENTAMMMEKNAEIWKDIYETTYGIPLSYTTEQK
ncbi:MAG: 1-acyl-sn-glycerol-3-phosphate acyltransferase [Clostridia bacterium]|nr:1-acyl-sn-glycerol-3-phosphate acyltransferase [Clostridia bacterium]